MGRNRNREISAALFKMVAPLLPVVVASAKGGRPRVSDEMALNGILFVLRTGIPREGSPRFQCNNWRYANPALARGWCW